jgi:hypothetical protein
MCQLARSDNRRCLPATWADAEDFEVVPVNGERRVSREVANQFVNGTSRKRHDRPTLGAHQVMPVPWLTNDVCRVSPGLEQPREHIDRGENFEGAIDRRPPDARQLRHQLLRREWPGMPEDSFNHCPARPSHPVTMVREDL